jgi:putative transposase
MDDARFYRRKLPHWRETGATYFVTWRLHPRQQELGGAEREIVATQIQRDQSKRYEMYAYVVMNDHVHVLVHPLNDEPLEKIVHSWKSFTARRMQREHHRQGAVWQAEYFDRLIRNEKEFAQKVHYIVDNPWKRWPELVRYQWVWPVE